MGRLWTVRWVASALAVPVGAHPVLGSWADLVEREDALGIRAGDPFMVAPDYRVDARLTRFFCRSSFAHLSRSTKRSYLNDYRVFFNFLWPRGRNWDAATAEDLFDFEDWRRRSPRNPARISGAKWNRELAALRRLYEWAARDGHVSASPVLVNTVRNRHGDLVEVARARAKDVRSSNVKWLTPRTFRLWRDVGLRGYTADGRRDRSWRGRHDDRNAAYADLLFSSGLRRTEAGSLLTIELPSLAGSAQRYFDSRLAAATAKNRRGRTFYVSSAALRDIEAYRTTTRRQVVRRAQEAGRYAELGEMWLVTARIGRAGRVLQWRDQGGRVGQTALDSLDPQERRRLFVEGSAGPEPLWLWLAEDGMPFDPHSWEAVFRAGSLRCTRLLTGVVSSPPFCTPHMCRHSFALHMLVALHHAMDQRFGLSVEERRDLRLLYGDPWRMVKDLLGHSSEQVTRDIYLAPVADLQLRSLLTGEDEPGVAELLSRIAAASDRVLDDGVVA